MKEELMRLRLASKIEVNEKGCWIWKGAKHKQGYGWIMYKGKKHLAHRLSWHFFMGEIPEKSSVCHKCDVTSCINPYHLFVGTQKENVDDAIRKGKYENRRKGRPRIKLNYDQVLEIKTLHGNGVSRKELQTRYKVGQTCIAKIITGSSWKINWTQEL